MSEGVRRSVGGSGLDWLRPRVVFRRDRFPRTAHFGRPPGVGIGAGDRTPGLAEHSEQPLDFDQRLLRLLKIGFPEAIRHVFVEAGKLQAHLRSRFVIESRAQFHQNCRRSRDRSRSFRDAAVFQMFSRIFHRRNGALVGEIDQLQRACRINLGFKIRVGVVSGHISFTSTVSDGNADCPVISANTSLRRLLGYTCLALASLTGIDAAASQAKNTQPAKTKESQPPAVVVDHRTDSAEEMQVSVDKQKVSVRLQAGEGGEADGFFTTPWSSPRTVPLPLTCVPMPESDLIPLVKEASLAQELSTVLIRAVIRRESASLWCAVSDKGAVGLMQLIPEVSTQFGADPFDAKQNIQAGSKYLKQLLTRYKGDTKLALAAYNAGPVVVDAAGGVPAIPETTAFVEAILKDIEANSAVVSALPKPE
jgi:hypothetical protein